MKMRQPLALLLGGIVSFSSVGCAAFNAMSEKGPGASTKDANAERLVSIGRVFENQGKYDQAEVMYRKALKQRPSDPVIRQQLTQLADRKAGRQFGPANSEEALAMADAVSGAHHSKARPSSNTAKTTSAKPATVQLTAGTSGKASIKTASATTEVAPIPPTPKPVSSAVQTSATGAEKSGITFEDVLAKTEGAAGHAAWLKKALCEAESAEARTLAATLLAECDPADQSINELLSSRLECETDAGLQLAICETQTVRGCSDEDTAEALIQIAQSDSEELQVQAIMSLRHFAGTEHQAECLSCLTELLRHQTTSVRAAASITAGDYEPGDETMLNLLTELAASDADPSVREAARAAIGRRGTNSVETAAPILIQPGTVTQPETLK
ncbi:MAG: HEAT repeat domain-containing protein [Planctomyces sp.]|nr:HEAT repeat domain-containing protein [Planctomyces sp.]